MDENELIEKLSELNHEQWRLWTQGLEKELMKGNPTTFKMSERINRKLNSWSEKWKPYAKLSKVAKDQNRKLARQILKIFSEQKDRR